MDGCDSEAPSKCRVRTSCLAFSCSSWGVKEPAADGREEIDLYVLIGDKRSTTDRN